VFSAFTLSKKSNYSNVQVISVLNKLSSASGGVTKVSLNRAALLSSSGFKSFIATLEYDPELVASVSELRSDERLAEKVQVLNFFVFYSHVSRLAAAEEFSLSDAYVSDVAETVRRRSRYIGLTGMRFNEYFNSEGGVFAQEIYDAAGCVVSFQILISGQKPLVFKTREEACTAWLEKISGYCESCVLIADASTKSEVVASVSSDRAHKVLTLHGNHFFPPYSFGSEVKPTPALIIDNMKVCDALVVLTNAQRTDIEAQFGTSFSIDVIPNSFAGSDVVSEKIRDPKLFVVVSRLEPIKNIAFIVRAFRQVVDSDPSLKLEIWGHGAQESMLRSLIVRLGLSDNVSLMGYTTQACEVFSRARASLTSSISEGFGLSLLESMSVGTPVIACAANYGPREIVDSGVDGFLIDDESGFAEKILQLAASDQLFLQLSKGALTKASKFTPEIVTSQWLALIKRMLVGGGKRHIDSSMEFVNTHSTTFGNLFFEAEGADLGSFSQYRRVEILRVDRTRMFKETISTVEPGIYRIAKIKYEAEHSRYCLWISQGQRAFDGVVPKGAIRFRLIA
jgi:glycosyltransferase involved in cell wall biosynthesis